MPRSYLYRQGYVPAIGHLYRTGFNIELDGNTNINNNAVAGPPGSAGPQGFQGAAGSGGSGGTGTINNFDDVTIINGQTGDVLVLGTGGNWENKTICEMFQYENKPDTIAICGVVNSDYGIAIGSGSSVSGDDNIALGRNNTVDGTLGGSIAVGTNNTLGGSANNTILIGNTGLCSYANCVNIGSGNVNSSNHSIVIGKDAAVYNQGVSIGYNAGPPNGSASGALSVAIGVGALSSSTFGQGQVAIGASALLNGGWQNIGIGTLAGNGGEDTRNNIAIGAYSTVTDGIGSTGVGNIAIGATALATGRFNSIALGHEAIASEDDAIAIGAYSNNTANNGICIGGNAKCNGTKSIVIGVDGASGFGIGSECVYIGKRVQSISNDLSPYVIAFGAEATGGLTGAISIGRYALGYYPHTIAIGSTAFAGFTGSIAIGHNCNSYTGKAIALGPYAVVETNSTGGIAIGSTASSGAINGIALGNTSKVYSNATNGVAIGALSNAQGVHSIAIGTNSYATQNSIMIGPTAGNVFGSSNIGIGLKALRFPNNASAIGNVAIGATALSGLTSGYRNTAIGCNAGDTITTGFNNVCIGYLSDVQPGDNNNVAIGYAAGVSGNNSLAIGTETQAIGDNTIVFGSTASSSHDRAIVLGYEAISGGNDEFCLPAAVASVSSGTAMVIASDGQVGPTVSSRKFKNNIRDLESSLDDKVFAGLNSRRFEWKEDGKTDIGFIAEELLPLCPELVPMDRYGNPRSVNYDRFVVLLFNRMKKLEKRIEELEGPQRLNRSISR